MYYDTNSIEFRVGKLKDNNDIAILVEKTTDVIYLQVYHGYNMGGITPMLDPETGLPLTYKVWKEKYDKR